MNAAVAIFEEGFSEILATLDGLEHAPKHELLDNIGRLVQEQTRRRITDEKTTPAGRPWPANLAGTPILYRSGALAGSIDYIAGDDQVMVGSGLPYAGIHQTGGKTSPHEIRAKKGKTLAFMAGGDLVYRSKVNHPGSLIPPRQYLGLSLDNEIEILDATEEWLRGLLQ
ncbi:MAG TPA: phage virion morphogenesis protein [Hyphomicrobiales bacterium]|nr:phage virion morphogenesis protein [Hyphomicrobiales bacterium]